jgi:hypothetical protein
LYEFIAKFANLWRVGYDMTIKKKKKEGENEEDEENAQVIKTLISDIKCCLYKCKSYSLLDISDD